MSIWIIITLLTAVWGLASLPRDIRDENKLQITLDVALIVLGVMALGMYLATPTATPRSFTSADPRHLTSTKEYICLTVKNS